MKLSIQLFVLILLGILLIPSSGAQYGILASPDKTAYNPGQMVVFTTLVPEESQVTFQVVDPDGEILIIKTVDSTPSTETEPTFVEEARIAFYLASNATVGTYSYYISAVSDDGSANAMVSGSFDVTEEPIDGSDSSLIPFIPVPFIAGTMVVVGFFGSIWFTDRGQFALFSLALLPLYTRLKPGLHESVDEYNNRGRIYQHIKENPGTYLSRIKNAVETSNGTTVYHLKVLEREGAVIKKGKNYFIRGASHGLFNNMRRPLREKELKIIAHLMDRHPTPEKLISDSVRIRQSTVNRTLQTLMDFGIVHREKRDGVLHYFITPAYRQWYYQNIQRPRGL